MKLRLLILMSSMLALSLSNQHASGEQPVTQASVAIPNDSPPFVRVKRDARDNPIAMETAIVSYVPTGKNDGTVVDLIGAVHIADAPYFEELNRRFAAYDVVLYELVAPEGTRIPKGGRKSQHPVAKVQGGMKSMLDLAFQLECIDYTKQNLVHADLSPQEFSQTMQDRGESFSQIFLRAMGKAMAQQNAKAGNGAGPDVRLLWAFFADDRTLTLKRIMAEQFEDLEGSMNVFDGPDGSTLISERNKRALEVLQQQLQAGKKRIGIFYGAGHMADMDRRLREAPFDLRSKSARWLVAWDLSSGKATP